VSVTPEARRSEPHRVNLTSAHSFRGLHGQLVENLGLSIGGGELAVGEQIIPEALALETDTSRAVVREALRVLETKGMVIARPRTGTRVRDMSEWDLLDPDVIRWRSTGAEAAQQLEELLAIRGAIEPLAARHASRGAAQDHLAALQEALSAMESAVDRQDHAAFTEADVAFHRALLVSGGNRIIAQFAGPIEAALRVRHSLRLVPDTLSPDVVSTHRAILDAILGHDEAEAELASRRIVDVAGAEVFSALIESPDAP
jgi:DNA-binding FadR family transcriptional regulator